MALFILRFILFSGLLYLCYRLLFSHLSFFRLNRAVLLLIPVASLLVPLVAPFFEAPALARPMLQVFLHEITITGQQSAGPMTSPTGFQSWWLLYSAGSLLVLLSVLHGLYRGWQILKHSQHAFANVHISREARGPFALFSKIVIPETLLKSEGLNSVLDHEKAHVEQRHGLDNLYYNLLCALFWFNPFMYLLNRELRQTHECLADEAALGKTSRESYARLMLSSAFGSEMTFDPANRFFNSSLIKTRITMMYKSKTNRKMKSLYLALLPLLAVMIIMSCQKTEEAPMEKAPAEKAMLGFAEADRPPLFEQCDANAPKEEQMKCFQEGVMHYVMENFEYPESAKEQKLKGKMYVRFVINESGRVQDVDVTTRFPDDTDPKTKGDAAVAAIRLVKALPNLAPAIRDGKKVPVSFVLPINMKLN